MPADEASVVEATVSLTIVMTAGQSVAATDRAAFCKRLPVWRHSGRKLSKRLCTAGAEIVVENPLGVFQVVVPVQLRENTNLPSPSWAFPALHDPVGWSAREHRRLPEGMSYPVQHRCGAKSQKPKRRRV